MDREKAQSIANLFTEIAMGNRLQWKRSPEGEWADYNFEYGTKSAIVCWPDKFRVKPKQCLPKVGQWWSHTGNSERYMRIDTLQGARALQDEYSDDYFYSVGTDGMIYKTWLLSLSIIIHEQ